MVVEALREFFQSYQTAWDALDAQAIAEHYLVTAIIRDGDGLKTYSSQADLLVKFDDNCRGMQAMGYRRSSVSEGTVIESGENGATVDLGWTVLVGEGQVSFRTTYMCTQVDGQWKIMAASVY